jgi:hypothetical protein
MMFCVSKQREAGATTATAQQNIKYQLKVDV